MGDIHILEETFALIKTQEELLGFTQFTWETSWRKMQKAEHDLTPGNIYLAEQRVNPFSVSM